MNAKVMIVLGAVLGASGVALGAYHAHGLEKLLTKRQIAHALPESYVEKQMQNCEVAVRYQMVHSLALLAVGILSQPKTSAALQISSFFFMLGVLFFSGGLYLMVFADNIIHWAMIPSGGLMLILGWLAVAVNALIQPLAKVTAATS